MLLMTNCVSSITIHAIQISFPGPGMQQTLSHRHAGTTPRPSCTDNYTMRGPHKVQKDIGVRQRQTRYKQQWSQDHCFGNVDHKIIVLVTSIMAYLSSLLSCKPPETALIGVKIPLLIPDLNIREDSWICLATNETQCIIKITFLVA